jgi:hypothetical protein
MRGLLCVATLAFCQEHLLDRIAVSVDRQVITEQEVLMEVRMAAFLEQAPLEFTPQAKRKAADRLVERLLVRRELAVSLYDPPKPEETEPLWKAVKLRFPTEASYQEALRNYGLTEAQLQRQLMLILTVIRFVEFRFRPGIQLTDEDLREIYDERVNEWRRTRTEPPPSFEDSRQEIENYLLRQRADQALDRWVNETRNRAQIIYRDKVFAEQPPQ